MRTMDKEMARVVKLAEKNGFSLARQRRHLVLKRGNQMLSMSVTPSCPFAARNAMGDLLRLLKETS